MSRRVKFYEGTRPDGMHHQSIYPQLFVARFKRVMSGQAIPVERVEGAYSKEHALSRVIMSDPHGEIRGDIAVEHLMDLDPVYA